MPNMVSRPSKTHSSPADEAGAFVCLFRCRQERQAMRAGTQQFTNLELFHDTSLLPKEKTEVFSRRRRLRKGVRAGEEENNPRAPTPLQGSRQRSLGSPLQERATVPLHKDTPSYPPSSSQQRGGNNGSESVNDRRRCRTLMRRSASVAATPPEE
jgi:hypothetical protein